jgi:hypothetical protein
MHLPFPGIPVNQRSGPGWRAESHSVGDTCKHIITDTIFLEKPFSLKTSRLVLGQAMS